MMRWILCAAPGSKWQKEPCSPGSEVSLLVYPIRVVSVAEKPVRSV